MANLLKWNGIAAGDRVLITILPSADLYAAIIAVFAVGKGQMCVHICVFLYVCVHVCVFMYTRVYVCAFMCVCNVCTCVCIYVCVHVCVCTCMCVYMQGL